MAITLEESRQRFRDQQVKLQIPDINGSIEIKVRQTLAGPQESLSPSALMLEKLQQATRKEGLEWMAHHQTKHGIHFETTPGIARSGFGLFGHFLGSEKEKPAPGKSYMPGKKG